MIKIPIPREVLEAALDMMDQEDVEDILIKAKEIDLETYDLLVEIAVKVGKVSP